LDCGSHAAALLFADRYNWRRDPSHQTYGGRLAKAAAWLQQSKLAMPQTSGSFAIRQKVFGNNRTELEI